MRKVIIIGCPGSGKSHFARALREKTGLPLYYLDMIYHRPDRTTVSRGEFDAMLEEIMKRRAWIIDGNYGRTLETRLKGADTVFLFDLPTEECLKGAVERVGTKREDMPWIETELDGEFKQWIENFAQNSLPKICELLGRYKEGKKIIIFNSRAEADRYLEGILE